MSPAARSGITASLILGIGRALGETMAVVMVAGNAPAYPSGLFSSFRVLTANIVMEMGYAGEVQEGALVATGVILLLFVLAVNLLFGAISSRAVRRISSRQPRGKRPARESRLRGSAARLARRIAEYGLLISLAPQVNGLSFTDEERAESLRARNRAIAALGLGSLVMAGKEGSSTLREVAFSLELGHPVLLWHSIVEEGEPWAIRLLENPLLDSQGRPLVQTVSSAADVEEALSPWSTVWWL
mgnify:CR=1 FL=1